MTSAVLPGGGGGSVSTSCTGARRPRRVVARSAAAVPARFPPRPAGARPFRVLFFVGGIASIATRVPPRAPDQYVPIRVIVPSAALAVLSPVAASTVEGS